MAINENEEFEFRARAEQEAKNRQPSFMQKMQMGMAIAPDSPATKIQNYLKTLGGNIASKGGEMGYPKTGVALGAIPTFLPEVMGMIGSPESEAGKISMFKPAIPIARQEAVNAARELSIPLTRAEQTGSMASSALESGLEKTPLGSLPIQKFREGQASALDATKTGLQKKMGTQSDLFSVGQKAIGGLKSRAKNLQTIKNSMFEAIPDNVNIPLSKSREMADTIIQEQSKFLPGTRNADVTGLAQNIQNVEKALSKGEPNYPLLKRLREVLNGRIQANNAGVSSGLPGQANAVGRDYLRLKSALDKDIETFVANQKTPLGSMVGKEFASSYKKANAFSGAYSKLFKGEDALSLAETPPEKIVDTVFKKNNETAIKRFHALVGDDGFKPAKQKFTQDLMDSKNVVGELKKYKPGTLEAIYSSPELAAIRKYGLAQSLSKGAEKIAGNPSGTGRQVATYGSLTGAGYELGAGHPLAAAGVLAGTLGAPYAGAKAYLSKAATEGVRFDPQIQKMVAAALQALRQKQMQPQ